jgi:protein tyrosine phosphatase
MPAPVMSESAYWGMVWKTNATKKEIVALHSFIISLIEEGKLAEEDCEKYKEILEIQEKAEHERLKAKMKRIGLKHS